MTLGTGQKSTGDTLAQSDTLAQCDNIARSYNLAQSVNLAARNFSTASLWHTLAQSDT